MFVEQVLLRLEQGPRSESDFETEGNGSHRRFMRERYAELGPIGQSVIKEMANIGLGNATTSLAEMTGHCFEMSVPEATTLAMEDLPSLAGASEDPFVGIYMPISGETTGHMGFFLSWDSAQALWKMLLNAAPETPDDISEMDASALIEVGNIINGSFLRAISEFSGVNMMASPPVMSVDMMSAMLATMAIEASQTHHLAISIRTEIFDKQSSFSGFFVMLPTIEGVDMIFRNFGIAEAS